MKFTLEDVEALLDACGLDASIWQKRMLVNLLNHGRPFEIRAKHRRFYGPDLTPSQTAEPNER